MQRFVRTTLQQEQNRLIMAIMKVMRNYQEVCEQRGYLLDVNEIDELCRLLQKDDDLHNLYTLIIGKLGDIEDYYDYRESRILCLAVGNLKRDLRAWYESLPPESFDN